MSSAKEISSTLKERDNISKEIDSIDLELQKSFKTLAEGKGKQSQMQSMGVESKHTHVPNPEANGDSDADSFIPLAIRSHEYYPLLKQAIEIFKYIWSTCLVIWCLCVIIYCVSNTYCIFKINPAASFIILLFVTTLLGYLEALHYANVSVEKWDLTEYKDRFPRACEVQKLVKTNKLVRRFLVGRQFFVIFVVFTIAQITSFPEVPPDLWGLPPTFVLILVQTGIPGIMWVLTFGQLIPQLFVEEFCLPFLNLPGCYSVTKLAFGAEFVGICHFSWLLFYSVNTCVFGKNKSSSNQDGNAAPTVASVSAQEVARFSEVQQQDELIETYLLKAFTFVKYLWSTFVTLGSVIIIFYGISQHYSVLPTPVA